MLTLIFGKDDYQTKEKAKEIIADYQKKTPTEIKLDIFDRGQMSFQGLEEELRNNSMFSSKRIFFFRNAFVNKNFKQDFLNSAENILNSKDLILFLEQRTIPRNDSLLKLFQRQGTILQFDSLSKSKMEQYIQKELKARGIEIENMALSKLMLYLGNDLWRISTELKKLIAFCSQKKIVDPQDIELLVKPNIESAIFETLEAIASQNKGKALSLVSRHIANNDSPFYLLSMINYQFRNLLLIKEQEGKEYSHVVKELKPLSPFVIKKNLPLAKKFSRERLEKIYFKIFKIDVAIKTGKLSPELGLELLIADI